MQLDSKLIIEDAVIKIHDTARHLETSTKEIEIAKMIRQMADEVSDKLTKVRYYGTKYS
jgi:hypothetical protein